MKTINIAKDFSPSPAGRFPNDGPYNGERFRDEFLAPALRGSGDVTVILDGVSGFGSSFLEEAFGGLIRTGIIDLHSAESRLKIKYNANNQDLVFYAGLIKDFMKDAAAE